ncbi:fumarylacetoacetate hydrolase family protein [Caulobacter sp. S45]|uniref:fumarylacetoacetate hydrolase family protein n=1 Tax=Caulobacter sp. S45 TaxID=1641861 RepID=UPI00131B65FE|nr:fumarylacetoacetate hydrolase family protein [Caulobacter sp. S45]
MKLCRFDDNRLGLVEGDQVRDVTSVLDRLGPFRLPLPAYDPMIAALDELKPAILEAAKTAQAKPLASVRLLSPVANPQKIVAAPVNYRDHLAEVKDQAEIHNNIRIKEIQTVGLFLKSPGSLIGPSEPVRLRHTDRRNDHEVELAVIIGKPANKVSKADAFAYVAGYAIGLDMTLRGPEERSFRKSIDTYTVLGPWLVTPDEIGDPTRLDLAIDVNGEPRQRANTADLILSIADLIEFASAYYTLQPGDVLLTGTPAGVGPVVAGDVMTASIQNIGTIQVRVDAA